MSSTAGSQAKDVESAFIAAVQSNFRAAQGKAIAGKFFKTEQFDQAEKLRAAMIDKRIFDRDRFNTLPQGRTVAVKGFERRMIFGRKLKSVATGTVIAPPSPLLDTDAPPPVSLADVRTHLQSLITDAKVPHVIGICSPSGFDDEVWNAKLDMPGVNVVLIAPRPQGGFRVAPAGSKPDARWLGIFDPEDLNLKLARVRKEIELRRTDLLTGGLTAGAMATRLGLPPHLVRTAFEQAARGEPELRVSQQDGDMLLFRGVASAKEERSMSLAEWVRSLFSKEGEEAKKINVLAERRAALSAKLDRMYEDIGTLEKKESQLLVEGKENPSKVAKRRVAAQIAHLRNDISRCNTTAAMLSKQINIISTHIHHLEMAQTGSVAHLPSSDELTEAAVNAEEILEQLSVSDELVSGLELNTAQLAASSEEAAILKELEGPRTTEAAKPMTQKFDAPQTTQGREKDKGPAQAE